MSVQGVHKNSPYSQGLLLWPRKVFDHVISICPMKHVSKRKRNVYSMDASCWLRSSCFFFLLSSSIIFFFFPLVRSPEALFLLSPKCLLYHGRTQHNSWTRRRIRNNPCSGSNFWFIYSRLHILGGLSYLSVLSWIGEAIGQIREVFCRSANKEKASSSFDASCKVNLSAILLLT